MWVWAKAHGFIILGMRKGIGGIFEKNQLTSGGYYDPPYVVILVSNDKKRVMLTLTKEVADDLEKIAKSMGLSKSALITSWINENRKESEQKK